MKIIPLIFLCLLLTDVIAAGTLSERNYNKLQEIHKLINNDQLQQAQTRLDQLLARKQDAYTQALFLQTSAHIAINQDQFKQAIIKLEKALNLQALPDFVSHNIRYNLSQLYVQEDDYDNSLKHLQRWLPTQKKLSVTHHVFAASVFGQKKQFKSAIKHIKQAIGGSKKPQESWYQLLISFHLAQKNDKKAIPVYRQLIQRFPKKREYWLQLSGILLNVKQKQQSLAVLALAYRKGLIDKERNIRRLANLYLYLNNPYQAGTLLEKELKSKRLTSNVKNWRQLADSWILAQEFDRAIQALTKAAELTQKEGGFNIRIGRIRMEQGQWALAMESLQSGLEKGIKDAGEAYLLLGITAFYANLPDKARKAFLKARQDKKRRKNADAWLQQLE